MRRIFLDHQSTTPLLPEALEAMQPFLLENHGSPSSLHREGLIARNAVAKAREQIAGFINAESPDEIIFTSGGTEAANLAVKGAAYAHQKQGRHIVIGGIESPAISNSVEFLQQQGFTSTGVSVDRVGAIKPEQVLEAVTNQTVLICVQHANHDIGTIEPIRQIAEIAREKGITFFVDALASGGWLKIDVQELGVDLLSLSPHRFYGPKGVGVLYRNRRTRLISLIHGGVQENGRRAGMENVTGIVGAGVAAEFAGREMDFRVQHVGRLQRRLWDGLAKQVSYLHLNGPVIGPDRIPTNLNVSFEFVEGEGVVLLSDVRGLALASGTSCVSKSLQVSPVFRAIGLDHSLALGAVMLSLGKDNTEEEIDLAVLTLAGVVERLRQMSPQWDEFRRGLTQSVLEGEGLLTGQRIAIVS